MHLAKGLIYRDPTAFVNCFLSKTIYLDKSLVYWFLKMSEDKTHCGSGHGLLMLKRLLSKMLQHYIALQKVKSLWCPLYSSDIVDLAMDY